MMSTAENGLFALIDFGSTFTKVVVFDIAMGTVRGSAQVPTTVDTDLCQGLEAAVEQISCRTGIRDWSRIRKLACSSAAGGLRMVAVGLVPELTVEAARRAALGAGAKLVGSYGYRMGPSEIADLESLAPDIILLTGGIDGGNVEVILHNAGMLAGSTTHAPIVVAGNRTASGVAAAILQEAGKTAVVTPNVMPDIDRLHIEPAQSAIREIFLEHIVRAKGFERARDRVEILMPTPLAVLEAAKILSGGCDGYPGQGDVVIVDVGGATTDVHSVGGNQLAPGADLKRGLPEPHAKRTVEGDLGIRYNAGHLIEMAGEERVLRGAGLGREDFSVQEWVSRVSRTTSTVPAIDAEHAVDASMAAVAVDIAMERHAGTLEEIYTPNGKVLVQYGKDLTGAGTVVGTGGIFAYGRHPDRVLAAVCAGPAAPLSLRPRAPRLLVDRHYILYAVGLLAAERPLMAARLAHDYLVTL